MPLPRSSVGLSWQLRPKTQNSTWLFQANIKGTLSYKGDGKPKAIAFVLDSYHDDSSHETFSSLGYLSTLSCQARFPSAKSNCS